MAAWKHSEVNDWDAWGTYGAYRKHVAAKAASFRGREEDCADFSMSLLVDFAAENGLALTFEDNAGRRYISKASGVVIPYTHAQPHVVVASQVWSTKEEYRKWVLNRIGVEPLWKRSAEVNRSGPENGDLMIVYKKGAVAGSGEIHQLLWSGLDLDYLGLDLDSAFDRGAIARTGPTRTGPTGPTLLGSSAAIA
jgi:hypothetical protein